MLDTSENGATKKTKLLVGIGFSHQLQEKSLETVTDVCKKATLSTLHTQALEKSMVDNPPIIFVVRLDLHLLPKDKPLRKR